MRVLGFGTYDKTKHPRPGILLDGLRELGDDVSELNAPLGFSTAERVAMLAKPWLAYRLVVRLCRRWLTLTAGSLRPSGSRPDAVLVGYLGHFDVVLARLLFPRTPIALDMLIFAADTARDRGHAGAGKRRILTMLDRLAIRCASLVIVDTEENARLISGSQRHKAVVVPVGAPADWFVTEIGAAVPGPLRVVFFGLFTPLQGAPVIGEAISALPPDAPIEITLVGTGQDLAETKGRAGDTNLAIWKDWLEPDELQELVKSQDVCLGIFADSPKAVRVVPNKVFQGAAAGCLVLTSDTPPQRRSFGDFAQYVQPNSGAELAKALTNLASERGGLDRLRKGSLEHAQHNFRPGAIARTLHDALVTRTQKRDIR
ncbi:glycosyltransferase family protein [Jatrophihabitans sp. DSM 45814]